MSTDILGQQNMSSTGIDSIDISPITIDALNNIFTSGTIDSGVSLTGAAGGPVYTLGSAIPNTSWTSDTITLGSITRSNTLQINGEGADVVVNGESLMGTLRDIQERLNMLRPNPELEAEWDALRELGMQYRELERQCQEKSKMWDTLKKMTPPPKP